jgi:superfamily II DNA or RNA helicase
MLRLRDYQSTAVGNVFREWETVNSTLLVMPTATGKTLTFCGVVQRVFPKRVMILAHREELIFQAQDKIRRYTGVKCEVEMADQRTNENHATLFGRASVIVSSIQTQNAGGDGLGRMTKFDPMDFSALIIDEAHHATADSYRRVLDYYRNGNPDLKILGVTATPDRSDEEALGQVFDSVAYDYEILDAIHDGWLVPIRQRMVEVSGLDFSQVRTTAGDLNGADLAAVMEAEKVLHGIASPTVELAGTKRTLVFATTVAHAERLAEIFQRHGRTASWICGKTPKDSRRQTVADFAAGRLQFLVNVGCLTEGFDDPGIQFVVIARPTKSRCLYCQMVGRGTRPLSGVVDGLENAERRQDAIAASGKTCIEILDFAGNAGRHKLMTTADILGGKVSDEAAEVAARKAKDADGAPVDMDAILEEAEREIRERRQREAATREKLRVKAAYSAKEVNPFDIMDLTPTREKGWERGRQLSDKQKTLLLKQGIDPEGRSYHECKQVLDELFRRWQGGLATFGQVKHLKRYGLPGDITREEASKTLDGIWKQRMAPDAALAAARTTLAAELAEVPF